MVATAVLLLPVVEMEVVGWTGGPPHCAFEATGTEEEVAEAERSPSNAGSNGEGERGGCGAGGGGNGEDRGVTPPCPTPVVENVGTVGDL